MINTSKDIRISIYDMFISVCQRWRSILICTIIGALVLGIYGWYRSGTEVIATGADESIYTAGLSSESIRTIDIKARRIVGLQKNINAEADYIEKSPFMKLDPYAVSVCELKYYVNSAEDGSGAALVEAYGSLLKDDSVAERIYEVLLPTLGETGGNFSYYEQIFSIDTSERNNGILSVRILGNTEEDTELLKKIVEGIVFGDAVQVLELFGNHEMISAGESNYTSADITFGVTPTSSSSQVASNGMVQMTVAGLQQNKLDELDKLYEKLSEAVTAVEPLEQAYCNYLIQEYMAGNSNYHEMAEATSEDVQKNTTFTRHINKKFIIVGAVLGLIIAVLFIVIKYIASAVVRTERDMEDIYGISLLGAVNGKSKFYTHRNLKIDRWLRTKRSVIQQGTADESAELIAAKISLASEQKGYKNLCVAVGVDVQDEFDFIKLIQEKLGESVTVKIVKNIAADKDSFKELSWADGAILVAHKDYSKYRNIDTEIIICNNLGINIIGSIVIA